MSRICPQLGRNDPYCPRRNGSRQSFTEPNGTQALELITRRSRVRIPPPLFTIGRSGGHPGLSQIPKLRRWIIRQSRARRPATTALHLGKVFTFQNAAGNQVLVDEVCRAVPPTGGILVLQSAGLEVSLPGPVRAWCNVPAAGADHVMPPQEVNKQAAAFRATTQAVCSCLLYTSPSPRDRTRSRMPSSA